MGLFRRGNSIEDVRIKYYMLVLVYKLGIGTDGWHAMVEPLVDKLYKSIGL